MQKTTIKKVDLSSVKTGDIFIRMISGLIPDVVIVGDMDDTHIWVGSLGGLVPATKEAGWKFRRDYGTEVDEDLGADGEKVTISYLIKK